MLTPGHAGTDGDVAEVAVEVGGHAVRIAAGTLLPDSVLPDGSGA